MGTKIFVNFTRYEYEECIRRLNNEIQSLLKATSKSSTTTTTTQPPAETREDTGPKDLAEIEAVNERSEACDWGVDEVRSWLAEVHPLIANQLSDCHGEHVIK